MARKYQSVQKYICKEHTSVLNNDKGCRTFGAPHYHMQDHFPTCLGMLAIAPEIALAGGRPTEPAWQQSSFLCVTRPQNLTQHGKLEAATQRVVFLNMGVGSNCNFAKS